MAKNIENEDYLQNAEGEEINEGGFELFFEENKQKILYVLAALVVVILAFYAYKKVYLKSLEEDAQSAMFVAEQYFERDSFDLAINGVNNDGFLNVINNYGVTKSANLAHYYVGVSYLQKGDYDKAIQYLEDFDGGDTQLGIMAAGMIGDAYSQKEAYEKAISYYEEAAAGEDDFVSPRFLQKAGLLYEKLGKNKEALETYELIKKKYSASSVGSQINSYITRAKIKAEGK